MFVFDYTLNTIFLSSLLFYFFTLTTYLLHTSFFNDIIKGLVDFVILLQHYDLRILLSIGIRNLQNLKFDISRN